VTNIIYVARLLISHAQNWRRFSSIFHVGYAADTHCPPHLASDRPIPCESRTAPPRAHSARICLSPLRH